MPLSPRGTNSPLLPLSSALSSPHQMRLRSLIVTQKKKLRMSNILLRKRARMTSSNNTLTFLRRRCRLIVRSQTIRRISVLLSISLSLLSMRKRRSFGPDANFACAARNRRFSVSSSLIVSTVDVVKTRTNVFR